MRNWIRARVAALWIAGVARWALPVVALVLLPAVALAQETPGTGDDGLGVVGWLMLAIGALIGIVAGPLGKAIVDVIPGKVDDEVRDFVLRNRATLEKWLDKDDPAVPPSPTNPTGTAG